MGGNKVNEDSTVVSAKSMALITSMRNAPSGTTASYVGVRDTTPTCPHSCIMAARWASVTWMTDITTLAAATPSQAFCAMANWPTCMIMTPSITMREHHSGQRIKLRILVSKVWRWWNNRLKEGMVLRFAGTSLMHAYIWQYCSYVMCMHSM
jgi:hypothetical protein